MHWKRNLFGSYTVNMSMVAFVGFHRRSTTWSFLVVLLVFYSVLNQATAQLNMFISEEDAKTYMSEYFSFKEGKKFVNISQTMWRRRLNRDSLFYFRDGLSRKVVPHSSRSSCNYGPES